MRHSISKLMTAAALLGFCVALTAQADGTGTVEKRGTVVGVPDRQADDAAPTQTPTRGMAMARVADAYGQPRQKHRTVGQPPITRWDYDGFSVFFENDNVLHSVVPGELPALHHRDELAAGG